MILSTCSDGRHLGKSKLHDPSRLVSLDSDSQFYKQDELILLLLLSALVSRCIGLHNIFIKGIIFVFTRTTDLLSLGKKFALKP